MQWILIFSFALVYFKASAYAASLQGTFSPDPENDGGYERRAPVNENLTVQPTHQRAENVTGQLTNQTAGYEQIVSLTNCSVPLVPKNGGLVCVYFENIYYCKPMCNQGYDFSFLRRSRLYEECGIKTAFTWTTQYLGGSRLAECIASEVLVSGQPSAYFSTEKCEDVISDKTKKQKYINQFISELKNQSIQNNHKKEMDFVACGKC